MYACRTFWLSCFFIKDIDNATYTVGIAFQRGKRPVLLIPFSKSPNVIAGPNGIITHPIKAVINVIVGLNINIYLLASFGNIISFINNFTASANACNNP